MFTSPLEYKSIVHSSTSKQTFCGLKDASISTQDGAERHLYFLAEFPVENVFFHTVLDDLFERFHEAVVESGPSKSQEEIMENALKAVNAQFEELAKDIDPAQFPNVRALLAMIEHNNIYLAPAGHVHAYYCTKQRVLDVLGTRPVEAIIHPETLFAQIVSGEFIPGSALILCTDRLIELFSPERLKRAVIEKSPTEAADLFSSLVANEVDHPSIVATFLKPDVKKLEAVKELKRQDAEPEDQDSMQILIQKEEKTKALLSPSFFNAVRRVGGTVNGYGKRMLAKVTNAAKRKPRTKTAESVPVIIKPDAPEAPEMPVEMTEESFGEQPKIQPVQDTEIQDVPKIETPSRGSKITAIFAKGAVATKGIFTKAKKEAKIITTPREKTGVKAFFIRAGARIVLFVANLSWPRRILLILSFVLVFVFAQAVMYEGKTTSNKEQETSYEQLIPQSDEKYNEAKAALLYNNQTGAQSSLKQARDLLAQIPEDHKLYEEQVVSRLAAIRTEEKVLNKEEDVQTTATTPLPEGTSTLSLAFLNNLYGASRENGKLYQLSNGSWSQAAEAEQSWKTLHVTEGRLIGVLSNGSIVEFKDGAISSLSVTFPDNAEIVDAAFFNGRLYLLDRNNKQIYKTTLAGTTYGSPTPWIVDETVDLGTPKSFYIDGSIYVLNEEGTMTKWFNGSRQRAFSSGTDASIIFSGFAASDTTIYLLSSSQERIALVNKEGGLIKQLLSSSINGASSITLNGDGTNLFVSTPHGMETYNQ